MYDLLVISVIVIIIIIIVINSSVITISVVDFSGALTKALDVAQRSDTLPFQMVARPKILLVTKNAAQVVAIATMFVLVVSTTAMCVVMTSILFPLLAVDIVDADGRVRYSDLCR